MGINTFFELGNLKLFPDSLDVYIQDGIVKTCQLEHDILMNLILKSPNLIDHDELIKRIQKNESSSVHNLEDHILSLCSRLKDWNYEIFCYDQKSYRLIPKIELKSCFDLSPNIQCIFNKSKIIKRVNPAWSKLGHKFDELISQPLINFIHPEDRQSTSQALEVLFKTLEPANFENRFISQDGSIVYLAWTASFIPGIDMFYGSAVDITDRIKREQMALLLSDTKSIFIKHKSNKDDLFDNVLSKVLQLTDSNLGFIGEILENKKSKYLKIFSMTDISWDEDSEKMVKDNAISGFEFKKLDSLYGHVIKTGEVLITNEVALHPSATGTPSGHPTLNNFLGIPLVYDDHLLGMVGVANCKTGYSMENYNYLKPFFDLLGEMLHLTRLTSELELQSKIRNQNAKLASIEELAAGVAHEICNPLAIIQGQVDMLKFYIEDKGQMSDYIEKRMAKASNCIERISDIVKGLREFEILDQVEFLPINLSSVLSDLYDKFSNYLNEIGIEFHFDVEEDLWIRGCRNRIEQVLFVLLDNAKYAVSSSSLKRISVIAKTIGENIEIMFIDTGPGIAGEIKDKIFDPFFSTKEVNQGVGIGLTLASFILKEHGGNIFLKENVSAGACFSIVLKCHPVMHQ